MVQHNKTYATVEEKIRRKAIYHDNLVKIARLSVENPKTRFGANKFADLTAEEFKDLYLSHTPMNFDRTGLPVAQVSQQELSAAPASWDWRTKGAVTPVKNQGQCGSCWTFSTTGNVEGAWFLAGHPLVGLSEQNLVDCDHDCVDGSCDAGCNGGLMTTAFGYIIKNGGIDTESSYPYLGFDSNCAFNSKTVGAKISNFTAFSDDETIMATWLAAHGPISVAVDAGGVWQFYMGGVLYAPCGTSLDHGVLLVGYGTETDILDQNMPYWTIKNSWGADWGDSGYIYIERGTGKCGVNLAASSSIV
eukprot:TRINITY_DN175_c0_g2_i1.p1 TRINITY_DN175_c0_g2~~TRINITY_DN175_c0_g2_i1.p1  ORF type:complete len:335 (+),score=87.59 TRINITY_DN175_c0_g2_i1:95-1006(+)